MPTPAMGLGGGGGGGGERAPPPHRSSGGGGGGGGNELFICFTSRPSTSSAAAAVVRAPSARSLPSPSRARDLSSLPASRSRRLRASGSLRGGQSPMFPPRKGGAFRPAEPSSPKVTCIGQVRVKPKAKDSALLRSESRNPGGSCRRTGEEERCVGGEQGRESSRVRSQSWVYQLPASICDALRAVGSEFNCFLPCGGGRSSCSGSSRGKAGSSGVAGREKRPSGSCGAVFVRWLMAVEEGDEEEKGEVVGLVVGEKERGELGLLFRERGEGKVEEFGVVGKVDEKLEDKEEVLVVKVEEKEEGVCVPPKNALLLMRCRSDPVRMAALANRFWGSPATKVQVENEEDEEEEEEEGDGNEEGEDDGKHHLEEEVEEVEEKMNGEELKEDSKDSAKAMPSERGVAEERESGSGGVSEASVQNAPVEEKENASEKNGEEEDEKLHLDEEKTRVDEEEVEGITKEGTLDGTFQVQINPTKEEGVQETQLQEMPKEEDKKDETQSQERAEEKQEEEMNGSNSCSSSKTKDSTRSGGYSSKCKKEGIHRSSSCREKDRPRHSFSSESERRHSFSVEKEARRASFSIDREGRKSWSFSIEKGEIRVSLEEPAGASGALEQKKEEVKQTGEAEECKAIREAQVVAEENRKEEEEEGDEEEEKGGELPDCLLLMMYEPKLSMEVSRETWVCSTDFIHGHLHQSHSRRRPPRPTKGKNGKSKTKAAVEGSSNGEKEVNPSTAVSFQHPPPLPPMLPLATAIEQKLLTGNAAALVPPYGPFVLTRCKSEPMRSSARLAADAGFWKNRHQPINAAAVGF